MSRHVLSGVPDNEDSLAKAIGEAAIEGIKEFLRLTPSEQSIKMLKQHERTGRSLGSDRFLLKNVRWRMGSSKIR
ncbi:MAG: hypothetical protein K8F52_15085 [Candidatus Scalindua rubra]|nr:hypothetical protein [Candidatus Scalindua rubra]